MNELRPYKTRLFLGEGDFSYACALVKKHMNSHPQIGQAFTATAYESEEELQKKYPGTLGTHLRFLREQSVTILFGVDAQFVDTHLSLRGKKFDCIHFNFPHDGSSYETGRLKAILGLFFKSSSKLQDLFGRIYMALPKRIDRHGGLDKKKDNFFKLQSYDIYENTRNAGYGLVAKRNFGKDRYPGYGHVQTNKSEAAAVAVRNAKEYVFEKTDLNSEEILKRDQLLLRKPERDSQSGRYILPEIKTDGKSTDYLFVDLGKPNLYLINDLDMANQWLSRLYQKRNSIYEYLDKGIPAEPYKIREFIKKLKSIEMYLCDTPLRRYYTHNSGLDWKDHISTWYYRSVSQAANTPKTNGENSELKARFISFLLEMIKKSNGREYRVLAETAMEALFFLFECHPERILREISALIENVNLGYRLKSIVFSILMKRVDDPDFRTKTLIPILIRSISYDPRLDWMIFFLLGSFDITEFLLAPQYRESFIKIKDFRLISRMLERSDLGKLFRQKEQLPNSHYQNIAAYLLKKAAKKAFGEQAKVMSGAVQIPVIYSLCHERDLISWDSKLIHVGLCPNVFMPAQSVVEETLVTNLQDRHAECSFLTLGRYYLNGLNGCVQNYRKGLSYFKIPADNGSFEALYEIVQLYSQGRLDVSADNLDDTLQHCTKLKNCSELTKHQLSLVFSLRGQIMFFKGELRDAETFCNVALRMHPENESALIYKAVLIIIQGNILKAKELLLNVKKEFQLYKKGLLLFIDNNIDRIPQVFNRAPREEFNLMAIICGIISYYQKNSDDALKCFSYVLSENPNHPTALAFCQKLNPELNISENSLPGNYELVFKCYETHEEYLGEKNKLHLRSNLNRGFFVFIKNIRQNSKALYLNSSEEKEVENINILKLSEDIIQSCEQNNQEGTHNLMLQLHRFITANFNVKPSPNLSLQLDEIEHLRIIESEEELELLQHQKDEENKKTPSSQVRIETFQPGEEQEDPEDMDELEFE